MNLLDRECKESRAFCWVTVNEKVQSNKIKSNLDFIHKLIIRLLAKVPGRVDIHTVCRFYHLLLSLHLLFATNEINKMLAS